MARQIIPSVVTAASSYNLTTLAVVKDELGLTTNENNPILTRYLEWASAALSGECNRVFAAETVKYESWSDGDPSCGLISASSSTLQLLRWPIISVSEVLENSIALVNGTDYRVKADAGQLVRFDGNGGVRRWSSAPLSVISVAGFATIPGDLADAVTRMVRNRFRARGRDSYLVSESIPGVRDARWWIATGNEAGNMPPDVVDLIENYRAIPVASA